MLVRQSWNRKNCGCAQVCDGLTHAARALCEACCASPQAAAAALAARAARLEAHTVRLAMSMMLVAWR